MVKLVVGLIGIWSVSVFSAWLTSFVVYAHLALPTHALCLACFISRQVAILPGRGQAPFQLLPLVVCRLALGKNI